MRSSYREARRAWRRFTGKPVRRFHRNFKRTIRRSGEGRGKGERRGFFYGRRGSRFPQGQRKSRQGR
eukprot:11062903-Lingulodinium_polyedra.AAC.1